jgi:L-alanine-DL-glutamate epimerase-like enolase superfamily enzyme
VKLDVVVHTLRLKTPLQTSYGELTERAILQVSIRDAQGALGRGEAAPLPDYDGTGVAGVAAALERHAEVLAHAQDEDPRELVRACRAAADAPAALAAIDMALWDRAGRLAGKPVAALLAERPPAQVAVNATLAARDRAGAAEQSADAVRAGFTCLKAKVGLGDDAGRIAAVRAAAGPEAALRVDANGAWSVEEAVRAIEALAPAGLELVEEPVHGVQAVREVRARVPVRIAIDETAAEEGALAAGAADAVCLKISRCGGICGLLEAAELVRASGAEPYVASTLDGPLGIAAGLHAAAALAASRPLPHCGLATLGLFAGLEDPLPPRRGAIALPSAPGLGVEPL